jgi:glycosyltransferase involved in cell wall biosynthesis
MAFVRYLIALATQKAPSVIVIVASLGDVFRTLPFIWLSRLLRRKVILYFHTNLAVVAASHSATSRFVARIWARSQALVFLSSRLAADAVRGFRLPTDRIFVIPNGVDASWILMDRKPLDERTLDVVYVGRWAPEKGAQVLQTLFSSQRFGRQLTCHVFGAKLQDDIDTAIVSHGWCDSDQLIEAISSAKVLVLPTFSEAYPLVLLEAAACGTPFVASSVGGVPDIIGASGGGIQAQPGDIEGFSEAICTLINDRSCWEERSRAAFSWARSQTVAEVGAKWRALLGNLD